MLNSVIDFGNGGFTWGIIYLQLENQQTLTFCPPIAITPGFFPLIFPLSMVILGFFPSFPSGSDPVGAVGRLAPLHPRDPVAAAAATLGGQEAGRRRPSAGHGGKNCKVSQKTI